MRGALCRLSREIIEKPDDGVMCVGVAVFDTITGCQQLIMLDYVDGFSSKTRLNRTKCQQSPMELWQRYLPSYCMYRVRA